MPIGTSGGTVYLLQIMAHLEGDLEPEESVSHSEIFEKLRGRLRNLGYEVIPLGGITQTRAEDEMETLVAALEQKRSVELQGGVIEEGVRRISADYNRALRGRLESLKTEFRERYSPISVTPKITKEVRMGQFMPKDYRVQYKKSEVGREWILQGPDGALLMVPEFELPEDTVSIRYGFKVPGGFTTVNGQPLTLIKPATCRQIDPDTWELVQKGELTAG